MRYTFRNLDLFLAILFVAALSLGCPKKEDPGPTPEPTPAPTAVQVGLCRETEMVSNAPVSYCYEVDEDGVKMPVQCPGGDLSAVPFCR